MDDVGPGGPRAKVGTDRWFDPIRFHEAKVPFCIELGALVADHLCRTLAAISGKSCRALVLDLDDTLWGGSIGDDGISGIRLGRNSPEGEAREAGIETIFGEYCPTQRNALVADLYPRLGFDSIEDDIAVGQRYRACPASHPRLKSFIEVKRS